MSVSVCVIVGSALRLRSRQPWLKSWPGNFLPAWKIYNYFLTFHQRYNKLIHYYAYLFRYNFVYIDSNSKWSERPNKY